MRTWRACTFTSQKCVTMADVMIKLSSSRIFKPTPQVTKQTPQQFVWVKWCSNKLIFHNVLAMPIQEMPLKRAG